MMMTIISIIFIIIVISYSYLQYSWYKRQSKWFRFAVLPLAVLETDRLTDGQADSWRRQAGKLMEKAYNGWLWHIPWHVVVAWHSVCCSNCLNGLCKVYNYLNASTIIRMVDFHNRNSRYPICIAALSVIESVVTNLLLLTLILPSSSPPFEECEVEVPSF